LGVSTQNGHVRLPQLCALSTEKSENILGLLQCL
jgi:hypothetical protein